MPRTIGAGLQGVNTEYWLAIVRPCWAHFRVLAIHRGTLSDLSAHASGLPVAVALSDDVVSHWLEQFPKHVSHASMLAYLQRYKAELLSSHQQHLTTYVQALGPIQQLHCWLLHHTHFWQACQPYLKAGFQIRAVEPLSYLNDRAGLSYRDPEGLLDRLKPDERTMAQQTLKLACRTNWATEAWLC